MAHQTELLDGECSLMISRGHFRLAALLFFGFKRTETGRMEEFARSSIRGDTLNSPPPYKTSAAKSNEEAGS